ADRTDAAAHLLLLVTNASPRGILRKLCCDHMESGGALAHGKARAGQAASRRLDSSTPFASDRPETPATSRSDRRRRRGRPAHLLAISSLEGLRRLYRDRWPDRARESENTWAGRRRDGSCDAAGRWVRGDPAASRIELDTPAADRRHIGASTVAGRCAPSRLRCVPGETRGSRGSVAPGSIDAAARRYPVGLLISNARV